MKPEFIRTKEKHNRRRKERGNYITAVVIGVICCAVLIYIIGQAVMPEKYDLKEGDIAYTSIAATREIKDEITTQKNIEEKRNSVQEVKTINQSIWQEVSGDIHRNFESVKSVYYQGNSIRDQWVEDNPGASKDEYIFSTTVINQFITMLDFKPVNKQDLYHQIVLALFDLNEAEITSAETTLLSKAELMYSQGIETEELQSKKDRLIIEVNAEQELSSTMMHIISDIVDKNLRPNKLYDAQATEEAREAAAKNAEVVVYRQGQNIVERGNIVTKAQIKMLQELGLLKSEGFDYRLFAGMGALVFILLAVIATYCRVYDSQLIHEPKKILLLAVIIVMHTLLTSLSQNIQPMMAQLTFSTILIAVLLNTRIAFVANIVTSVITGMMVSGTSGMFSAQAITITLVSIVSGSVAVFMSKKPMHRMRIMMTGLLVGLCGMITSVAMGLILYADLKAILLNSAWSLAMGLISAVLCVGTLPVWEAAFDILTPTKLLELTNPNHPLLRRLALEAPGTHHHSIVVANLAEAAAEAIGANAMLVRAGAYFHDVGKLTAPECYTENQPDKEKSFHKMLTPAESAAIIRSHTTEGNELANKYKLPKEIRDIILQHHSTSPIYYFYAKALESGEKVDIADFSYQGPKPTSKEAALIMIADSVEAAVRSLPEKTPEAVRAKIDDIIKDRLANGAFDDCDISLLDLKIIADEYTQVLTAVHHERIEYPDLKKAADKAKQKKADEEKKNANRNN